MRGHASVSQLADLPGAGESPEAVGNANANGNAMYRLDEFELSYTIIDIFVKLN